jgi:HK97 gp10 family phage protein
MNIPGGLRITMKVEGLQQLGARFKKLQKNMQLKTAGRATSAGARLIKRAVKSEIEAVGAVDTTLLASAVIMKRLPVREAEGATAGYLVTIKRKIYPTNNPKGDRHTRRTAVYNEYGTVKMEAQPYLRRALYANRRAATDAIVERLRVELDKEKV